jgi:formate-dependent nitrite reductase membrane component NrfD
MGGAAPRRSAPAPVGYYGLPVLHRPHWKWLVISYFFFGGIAGASYVVASLADLAGGRANARIARAGRYLSFAALLPCPPLLILDLGRPERFLHMLRVVKLRSPMSLGTWGLLLFSACSVLAALGQAARDGLLPTRSLPRPLGAVPARAVGLLGTVPALFISGYTGVLLAATAVPLWTKSYLLLGPLFLASALSSAAAALTALLALWPGTPRAALERLARIERLALGTELALLLAERLVLGRTLARPLAEGHTGRVLRAMVGGGLLLPLALHALARPASGLAGRAVALASSLLALAGGFGLRYVVVMAGHVSADDPAATFVLTRGAASEPPAQ